MNYRGGRQKKRTKCCGNALEANRKRNTAATVKLNDGGENGFQTVGAEMDGEEMAMAKVRGASEGNRGPSLRRLPLHMPFENNSSEPFFFPDTCFAGGGISRMYSPLFQWGLDLCLSHTRGCNIRRAAGADLHT